MLCYGCVGWGNIVVVGPDLFFMLALFYLLDSHVASTATSVRHDRIDDMRYQVLDEVR